MSLLDVDFKFKCVADVEKSGLNWDYRFNQLQEITTGDERTLIVSDSIQVAENSERWISESSPQLAEKTVLFHGSLNQEKFAANFQAFIVEKTASIGCSTSKMTAGLNFDVDHVIIAQLGKARFLDNEINTAITNIGRTGRNKKKGRVTIIFSHEDKELGEHLCAKLVDYFPDDTDLKVEVEKVSRFFQMDIMQLLEDTFKNPALPEEAAQPWVQDDNVNDPLADVENDEETHGNGDDEDDDDEEGANAAFIAQQDADEAATIKNADKAATVGTDDTSAMNVAPQAPAGGW